jgi:large subunit ribosomal protein L3
MKGILGKKVGMTQIFDPFLFSVELELQNDLETGRLPHDFRQRFLDFGISLSANVTVTTVKKNSLWLVDDQKYIVKRTDEALNVHLSTNGQVVPVTVIEAGPCYVTQIKTKERDGYRAIQLGFEETREKKLTQGRQGHLKANDLPLLRHLREIRVKDETAYEVGQEISADIFETGERVDVVGKSKGRGFAGAIKRHNFRRQPKTHGQSDRERAPGSAGATTGIGRVFKGKRMPGRMGNDRVTAQYLEVALVDPNRNLVAVRGSVPGPKGGLVLVKQARKQG